MASTAKIILVVGGIFIAGAVTGGFVSLRVADHLAREKQARDRIGPAEIGGRLVDQLRLTPEQNQKIRPIINSTSEELRKVRRESFNQTATLVAAMDVEISKVLTEEQRVLLKDVRAREEERRKQWMAERNKRREARPPGGPEEGGRPAGGGLPPPDAPPPSR
ncbi:MAG: hypothetical protein ABW223_08920 [Rariglobus sp.]